MDDSENKYRTLSLLHSQMVEGVKIQSQGVYAYSAMAIRGAFFLNGAAALAVLAKGGSFDAASITIIKGGAIGAVLAVLSAGASYLSQSCFSVFFGSQMAKTIANIASESPANSGVARVSIVGISFMVVAIGLFCGSIWFFYSTLMDLLALLTPTSL